MSLTHMSNQSKEQSNEGEEPQQKRLFGSNADRLTLLRSTFSLVA